MAPDNLGAAHAGSVTGKADITANLVLLEDW